MQIGIAGLGKMGYNMALRLLERGHQVLAFNRSYDKAEALAQHGAKPYKNLKHMISSLDKPRLIWLMLPAGEIVDKHIQELIPLLNKGDIIVDGANTHYPDDIRRAADLAEAGIHYVDAGVSGGIWGLKNGYCMMIGGERKIFDRIHPILSDLAPEDGLIYCGSHGAGHYAKMVHNGMEYAIMQAYAEGFELLKESRYSKEMDLSELAHIWNHGSVIRSWLLELCRDALRKNPDLEGIKGFVPDSGEGRWTVLEGVNSGVPLPVITASLFERFRSQQDEPFALKILSALRGEFGGHNVLREEKE